MSYLESSVKPAMENVASELVNKGYHATVNRDERDRVWLDVRHGDEIDFFYSVHARPFVPPTFIVRDTTSRREQELRYYQAEVYLKEGGQDYNVMGWSAEQLIADIIDQYEKHMHFLHALR